jgi:hypothetical protein
MRMRRPDEGRRGIRRLRGAQVFDVAVSAQASVVGEIEAVVVGIFVDDDLVGAPVPVIAEAVVGGEDAESEATEPEAFAIAAFDAPDVAGAEAAGEVAVRPSMIDMVAGIIFAGVVADPFAVGVDVRGVGMAGFVGIVAIFDGMSVSPGRRGTTSRRTRRRSFMAFLRERRKGADERESEYS